MSAKTKKNSKPKNAIEKYPPPDPETLDLNDESYVFKCALNNEYQAICGAFDVPKEVHPLAAFILEKNLLNLRDQYSKTVFDLACFVGNKEFLKAIMDRTADKEKLSEESVLNLREPVKPKYAYNFMHYACIWNRLDVVKFLAEQDKLIVDPEFADPEPSPAQLGSTSSTASMANKNNQQNLPMKTLGSVLLRSKTRYHETPRDLARRYKHHDLVDYLSFAEKRLSFVEFVNDIKVYVNDTERHQNKLPKDDKKRLEKIYAEMLIWFEKNRESSNLTELNEKITEVESEVKSIYDKVQVILNANQLNSTTNMSGAMSSRSKTSHKNSINN